MSTLNFVIKDEGHMMAFLHYTGRKLYHQTDSAIVSVFLKLRFKMKLGYECWLLRSQPYTIVVNAIQKTLNEM
jgi:hypothetical protein